MWAQSSTEALAASGGANGSWSNDSGLSNVGTRGTCSSLSVETFACDSGGGEKNAGVGLIHRSACGRTVHISYSIVVAAVDTVVAAAAVVVDTVVAAAVAVDTVVAAVAADTAVVAIGSIIMTTIYRRACVMLVTCSITTTSAIV